MTGGAAAGRLCTLASIEDEEARGFTLGSGTNRLELLIYRRGGAVFGYVNCCPHAGTPLEMEPDRFMTADGSLLLCHTHGALFEPTSGLCVAGPCRGKRLPPLDLVIEPDGWVRLTEPFP